MDVNRVKRYYSILLTAAMMGLSVCAQMNLTRDDNPLRKLSIAEMAVKALYVDEVDEERALQFAAVQIDMPAETYVSFRGTDSTLVGWREDFMLSFTVTESQREAAGYLERAIARATEQGKMVRVGGHSKGGNLAEYAAALCPEELRERIVRVYSNDGPGMAPEVMSIDSRKVLGGKLRRIVPSYSIIGMLFARETDEQIVVRSTGSSINQHDPTTWQVMRSGVDEALGLQKECVVLNKAIAEWAAGFTLIERARAIDEVFETEKEVQELLAGWKA